MFAGDLFRMYSRYAEVRGWKLELIDISETGLGGIKEAVLSVTGEKVFSDLKYERNAFIVKTATFDS